MGGESRGEERRLILPLLDWTNLEAEQALVKVAMKSNTSYAIERAPLGSDLEFLDLNPLTKLWRLLDANYALVRHFGEYVKLAEIAIVYILGFVEDERCFLALSFVKDKLRNKLTDHLSFVVSMHRQQVYSLITFMYDECFK